MQDAQIAERVTQDRSQVKAFVYASRSLGRQNVALVAT